MYFIDKTDFWILNNILFHQRKKSSSPDVRSLNSGTEHNDENKIDASVENSEKEEGVKSEDGLEPQASFVDLLV